MSATLFDLEHKCAGPWCRYCETTTGPEAKALAIEATVSDPEWNRRANVWLFRLGPNRCFTADDLTGAIGLPMGSGNQVGAKFNNWAQLKIITHGGYTKSKRASNHGRVLSEWVSK